MLIFSNQERHANRPELHQAAKKVDKKVLRNLLRNPATDVNMKDGDGKTALCLAAVVGHETITRILLQSGVKIESEDFTGRTALHYAATEGHGAVVKQLLCGGANIEAEDDYGKTPLHCAVENKQVMVVLQLLLENTSNIQIKRARMAAARTLQSRYEAVAWLLKYGLDIGSIEKLMQIRCSIGPP